MEENKKDDFKFTRTTSCPNCPINCYSYKGALKHAELCNARRKDGLCCMCKKPEPNNEEYGKDFMYYSPDFTKEIIACFYR